MSTGCAVSGTKRGGLVRMLEQATHALAMQLPSAQGADLMTEVSSGEVTGWEYKYLDYETVSSFHIIERQKEQTEKKCSQLA